MRGPRLLGSSTLLAAAIAGVYLIWGPPSQDLAAATFRADLFADHGFVIWNNAWYSGHYLLSYSVLYPPLGALLGPRLAGAVGAVAGAAIFAALAGRAYGERAAVGSLWFAAALGAWLFTGRMPFLLAVAFGLAALLPAGAGWGLAFAACLAGLCSLTSPIAGLFLALAGLAIALAGERARGIALAGGAAVPIAALNVAFPTGGDEPFVFSSFIAIPILAAAVLWLVPAERRDLRIGAVLYALLALILFLVPNAVGGNVARLGALIAGPTLAMILWPRSRLLVVAVSLPLLYWQLVAPVRDIRKAAGDPSTERSYFAPLNAELDRLVATEGAFRTEIPPTRNRWEAAYVAPDHPIARGWLRQLESDDFDLFSDDHLTPAGYRDWLNRHGVSYVALSDAKPDPLAEDEASLVGGGLDYLQPVWRSEHWRLYRVDRPDGLAEAGIDFVGPDVARLTTRRPGELTLPLNWTRYWSVESGDACVSEGDDGLTALDVRRPGPVELRVKLGGDHCG
ncbi:MAG: hypothetical protein ACJ75R_04480 [Solirubrobacterales bacterium]